MAVLTEEQSMLRDAAKSWVSEKSPVTAFRKMRDSGNEDGFDKSAWKEIAEMGWTGIIIPEESGAAVVHGASENGLRTVEHNANLIQGASVATG